MARLAFLFMLLASASARAEPRVVAIGDLHGDVAAARCALRRAGAIDAKDRWSGGSLVVVQTGDQLDRGDDEPELLGLLDRLRTEAAAAGGRVLVLNGNHELMNVAGDFRYVTPDGLAAYGGKDGRRRAFAPGSTLARALAERPIYAVVGDTLFVHGGVQPRHLADGLAALDAEARAWMRGEETRLPRALTDPGSPLWTRIYGSDGDARACHDAAAALSALGLRRMVVSHTVQPRGINAICDGLVWRIDAGLGRAYGGHAEILEIRDGRTTVLKGCGSEPR